MKVLLISEKYIKDGYPVDDNISPKHLRPAMQTAQDIDLAQTIGTSLLRAICGRVADGSIKDESNEIYKTLLDDYIRPFLAYMALSRTIVPATFKTSNMGGAVVSDDEKAYNTLPNVQYVKKYYEDTANVYKAEMQRYMAHNRQKLPELQVCECVGWNANTTSSISSGVFLGGARGKVIPAKRGCDDYDD